MSAALRNLLAGIVDYAGLFPPTALPMREAVANYARYRVAPTRAMLARFVVPVARLSEFVAEAQSVRDRDDVDAWPLAVLAGADDAEVLDAFDTAWIGRFRVDTVEAKAETASDIAALAAALTPRRTVYVEIPVRRDPDALVSAIATAGMRAKIRTGGVTADAFPSPDDVLRFLAACATHGVPFKATAGLHHPLRGEYALTYLPDAAQGTMYGFVNVFLAAAMLRAGHPPTALRALLEERDITALTVTDGGIAWRDVSVDAATLGATRAQFAGSFGSCSFEEPVRDLDTLSLLPFAR